MLSGSGKSIHLCLVLDVKGKVFSLSALNMLSVKFLYMPLIEAEEEPFS